MNIHIDNQSGQLNDYYFQTLCLLYFPGEKFPPSGDDSGKSAYFKVTAESDGSFAASVKLISGDKSAEGYYCSRGYIPATEMKPEFYAQLALGSAYLEAGQKLFGFTPPWGYLTGLRPVKRARYYLTRGCDTRTVSDMFVNDYRVAPQKAHLSIKTALIETEMLKDYKYGTVGLYVSIPFCPTRCEYCSFISYATKRLNAMIPDYLVRLHHDLESTAEFIKEMGFDVGAVYIGGGTPTVLDEAQLSKLLHLITDRFDLSKCREFTCESGRPDTITKQKIEIMRSMGVDRISVNPQTIHADVLKRMGRLHTPEMFYNAAEMALSAGFKCVNADLIAGLPGDSFDGFCESLHKVHEMGFGNITVHTLSVKNAASIRFDETDVYDPEGTRARKCVEYANRYLERAGMRPYYLYRQKNTVGNAENTGYAYQGLENLYNVLMMEEVSTVFACGAGSITKLVNEQMNDILRIASPKYPYEYLETQPDSWQADARHFFGAQNR